MKFSYHTLAALSGTKKSPEELAALLMMRAFEVESVAPFAHSLDNVVIGSVIEANPHPDADKLKVTRVDTGDQVRQIVCGAPNVAAGQKVAVALPGAKLPGNMDIQATEIRGVASEGMICSEKELGFGDNHAGILVLSDDAEIGRAFAEYAGLADFILDIKILADRGSDALSYRGLAREIAALEGRKLSFDSSEPKRFPENPIDIKLPSALCSRYAGFLFENVEQGVLPLALRSFLFVNGSHPISAPVDITNYFRLMYGQPMHAFDADAITGKIIVREAEAGEKLELLSGETITLAHGDLVIADEERVLALAGVMGGKQSAVTDQTTRVFLEIATFDPASIRRTRIRHNLATDSAYLYERGPDANALSETFVQAAELFAEHCQATVAGFTDVYPLPVAPRTIELPLGLSEKVLGVPVEKEFIRKCLEAHGCQVEEAEDTFRVTVPTRRRDLEDEWNLVEEIGRTFGYENIPAAAPKIGLSLAEKNLAKHFERSVKDYLASAGFDETMSYSLYGASDALKFSLDPKQHLILESPLSPELALLRPSVLVTALMKAKDNLRYFDTFRFFEYGSAYTRGAAASVSEDRELALILTDARNKEIFSALKGKVEALLDFAHQGEIVFEPLSAAEGVWHPSRSAHIMARGEKIGTLGEIAPYILSQWGVKQRIAAAVFSAPALAAAFQLAPQAVPLPKFPLATRDISLMFPKSVTVAEVTALFREAGEPLLRQSELFDVYEQDAEKSLAFHLSFGADDRTLSSEEMDAVFDRIVALAEKRFKAYLRVK